MQKLSQSFSYAALLLGALATPSTVRAASPLFELKSPDAAIVTAVTTDNSGHLTYAVRFHGKTVLNPSAIGIRLDGQDLGRSATLDTGMVKTHEVNETYPTRGVHSTAQNHYREADLTITGGQNKTPWILEIRAFNNGVAYRYRVSGQGTHHIDGEATEWRLAPGSTVWYQGNLNEYEGKSIQAEAGNLPLGTKLGTPVTAQLPGKTGFAVMTEANLINYSDMALETSDTNCFKSMFHADLPGWNAEGEVISPWRVTLISQDLNGIVNTDILHDLCPPAPPELANADWIQLGRTAWEWLVNYHPKIEQQHAWVDSTSKIGFEYYLIDDGWKNWVDGDKDQWACLKDVVDYARTKNVKILAWTNSNEVFTPEARTEYFTKAKAAGLAGLKIDFPHPADTTWVQWYEDTLKDAEKFHFIIDFHGAVKPTGRDRTWPNEVTREAIRGRENGPSEPAESTVLPFTRYVQGHADYTPTMLAPNRLSNSTWPHELAQAIVYTSPLLCYADFPDVYFNSGAVDVFKAVPSTWDETIVLPSSEIGKVAAYARRKGDTWFIGIINGSDAQKMNLDLSFLGKGNYKLVTLSDLPEGTPGTPPRRDGWQRAESTATSKDKLPVTMRVGSGFVAWFTKDTAH